MHAKKIGSSLERVRVRDVTESDLKEALDRSNKTFDLWASSPPELTASRSRRSPPTLQTPSQIRKAGQSKIVEFHSRSNLPTSPNRHNVQQLFRSDATHAYELSHERATNGAFPRIYIKLGRTRETDPKCNPKNKVCTRIEKPSKKEKLAISAHWSS